MDFRRIEVIFIVVFAILNIYLFGSFWQYHVESSSEISSGSSSTTILKEMRNDQIAYMPLSTKVNTGYYAQGRIDSNLKNKIKRLENQSAHLNDGKITSTLDSPLGLDPDHPNRVLDVFIKKTTNVIDGKDYKYNANLSNQSEIVYTQVIDGRPVYSKGGQIDFYVNENHEVRGYLQGHLSNTKQLRESSDLISQTRAVTYLYQYNEIQNNSKIAWADLGYSNLLTTDNGVVYVPTWIIGIRSKGEDGLQVKRINAFTGVLIKKSATGNQITEVPSATENSNSTANTSPKTDK